ncbi:OmpW/AlkL family protein [Pseudomarimonas arenosa]|uniref:OmpW family protein n=1 Tax=Pseudomarimonas arenosa TaxID=2774145 RepID=A0AAW3ZT33_9GAMM|nr:OmpW family outer membrane protein [Pseudomarimonas arenosa]MBD8528144.1 OmpW family protein [Pseudomarimonas arenosa]
MRVSKSVLLMAMSAALVSPSALAEDWFVRLGAHAVDPKSDNGTLAGGALQVDIGSDVRPTLVVGRFLDEHWALELLAAAPFEHEVKLNGDKALDFKHLPPTFSVQYYFGEAGSFRPFVGAGVNYTWTYDERESGALAGTRVGLENSWGLAAQLGFSAPLADRWQLIGDLRWIDIDAKVKVNGAEVGSVAVDPLVYGLYASYSF